MNHGGDGAFLGVGIIWRETTDLWLACLSKLIWLPPQQKNGARHLSREPKVNNAQLQGQYDRCTPSQCCTRWSPGGTLPPFWVQCGVSTATKIIRSNSLYACMKQNFCKSPNCQLPVQKKKQTKPQLTNLNALGGDFTVIMLAGFGCYTSLVSEWITYFGRFTHFVYAPCWSECDQTFLLYCLEKSSKGNTWRVQWPLKLPDWWLQLFPLCECRQEWWFMHWMTLVFDLLWAALLHPPAFTKALSDLGPSARTSQCGRWRHRCTQTLEKLFQGCKGPISATKKATRCWVSTNQVKLGG